MQTPLPPVDPPNEVPPAARVLASSSRSSSRKPLLKTIALALAILGGVICGVLLRLGYGTGGPVLGASLCAPTQSVNCDFVLASRWARVGSLPVAALGLAYFVGLAAWLAFVGFPNRAGRVWHLVPLAAGALGLCASIYFVDVMAVHLPVWCTWCLAAHAVNALLYLTMLGGWPRAAPADAAPIAPVPSAARALTVIAGGGGFAVLVIAVIVAVGAQMTVTRLQGEFLKIVNNVDYIAWRYSRGEVREIPIRPDDLTLGPADAANTVVLFADFQCTGCAGFHRYTAQLLKRHPDVRFVFKHYPMSRACNEYVHEGFHYFACEAAHAAVAARSAGTGQQALAFQSRLFENFGRLDERPYASLAKGVGIDPAKFAAALAGPDPSARLAEDIELAHQLGVEFTPAVFLDGRKLWNWHLLTTDARSQVDLKATEELWDRLLGK